VDDIKIQADTRSMANDSSGPRGGKPDPEVAAKPKRRVFSAKYKLRVLKKAEKLREQPGKLGEFLRQEGLYSSHITTWTRERDRGALAALGKKRGRQPDPDAKLRQELEKMKKEKAQLERRLERAEAIISLQKKASELLGLAELSERS
jgi:hypothetical protein